MNAVCDVQWEIDGRLPHLQNTPRTRRLCIKWNDPCYEKAYLFMVKPSRTSTEHRAIPPDFLGRRLRMSSDVDNYDDKVETIQKWLGVCMHNHSECRPGHDADFEKDLRQTGFFGVINVETMRFTPLPVGAQYVALSYQWGQGDDTRYTTTVNTVLHIMTGSGLMPYLANLPLTIRESINLVRALEFKYLWVDSICEYLTCWRALSSAPMHSLTPDITLQVLFKIRQRPGNGTLELWTYFTVTPHSLYVRLTARTQMQVFGRSPGRIDALVRQSRRMMTACN